MFDYLFSSSYRVIRVIMIIFFTKLRASKQGSSLRSFGNVPVKQVSDHWLPVHARLPCLRY